MRGLSDTLLEAQKAGGEVLGKLVLTKASESTQTYSYSSTNRLLDLKTKDRQWSQTLEAIVENRDGNLTGLDLKGYMGVPSYGMTTSAGDEYSDAASLWVTEQVNSSGYGDFVTYLKLIGIFDLMAKETASEDYLPLKSVSSWQAYHVYVVEDWMEPTTPNGYHYKCTNPGTSASPTEPTWSTTVGGTTNDGTAIWTTYPKYTATVKDLLTYTVEATLPCFSHTTAWTLIIDWEDTLFDSYQPKDSLKIYQGQSRLSVIQWLMPLSKCIIRAEAGEELHVRSLQRIEEIETWQATNAYVYDDMVKPTSDNGYHYFVDTEGTSGGTEPTWPTLVGELVTDGTVIWKVAYDYEYQV